MSTNFGRKIERKKSNKNKKEAQKEMVRKIGLFNKLPTACSSCGKDFDRKSKEDHMTWKVNVMPDENVFLFCPPCQVEEKNE